jgi:hypothetical protein
MIKTFRGLLNHDEEDTIRLSTKKGKVGYKIFSFSIMTNTPGLTNEAEHVVKIFKVPQSTNTGSIDFSDGNLLAAAFLPVKTSIFTQIQHVIFEQEIFNQDIFITAYDNGGNAVPVNYYLELETMSLTDNAAAVSTLRDIRLNPQVGA